MKEHEEAVCEVLKMLMRVIENLDWTAHMPDFAGGLSVTFNKQDVDAAREDPRKVAISWDLPHERRRFLDGQEIVPLKHMMTVTVRLRHEKNKKSSPLDKVIQRDEID
jgi:hypothetical protein